MRWSLLLLSILSAFCLCVPIAHAQSTGQFQPNLDLRIETQPADPLPRNDSVGNITVRWTYTFRETTTAVLAQSSTGTTIRFTPAPACSVAGLVVTGPASVPVVFAGPGASATNAQYEGVVEFDVRAANDAPANATVPCMFYAVADAVNSQIIEATAAPVTASVVTAGNATVDCALEPGGCLQSEVKASPVVHPAVAMGIIVVASIAARRRIPSR